ncbi:hypothetical protein [Aquipuribacter sp. MA13-6]|uniref:hypothetical protein n=1 Tax=unclassified Aquipuribacter TaxID=2635084 RepID=UPI003EEE1E73
MTRRPGPLVVPAVLLAVALSGCAGPPTVAPAAQVETTAAPPSVLPVQATQVRQEVARRLQAARSAADPALVAQAAVGPAAALELLRLEADGVQPDAVALDPAPAAVLVGPRTDGWPRWFAAVTDPSAAASEPAASAPAASAPAASEPAASAPADDPSSAPGRSGELPVLELYDSDDVRSPYRLWGRMTLLPGAELPAFPDPRAGSVSLADGTGPEPAPEDEQGDEGADEDEGADGDDGADGADGADELQAVLAGLADGYASVLTDGDASAAAAEFEPDPFVEGVLARAEAEQAAVEGVATTTVTHEPYGDDAVLYAVEGVEGDVLAVTAVETVTTMTVRSGAGVLQPGAELREVVGIESTDGTLTTRSVAALAFVVPAERGAIRLVAVGEGLVAAEAS